MTMKGTEFCFTTHIEINPHQWHCLPEKLDQHMSPKLASPFEQIRAKQETAMTRTKLKASQKHADVDNNNKCNTDDS